MAADVGLDLRAGQVGRVQRVSGRHRRHPEEGMVLIHEIPAAAVDREIAPHLLRERPLIVLQLFVECQAFRIALTPVHPLEVPAGDHQLIDHLALPQGQSRVVERHTDRLEASEPLVRSDAAPVSAGGRGPEPRCATTVDVTSVAQTVAAIQCKRLICRIVSRLDLGEVMLDTAIRHPGRLLHVAIRGV